MNRCLLVLSGLALLMLGGCVRSEQPLSAMKDARPDERLVGQWRSHDPASSAAKRNRRAAPAEDVRISFDAQGVGHVFPVLKNAHTGPEQTRFFVTRTAKNTFLNVENPEPDSRPLYEFYKYRVSQNQRTLHLWSLQAERFEAAVKAGQILGKLNVAGSPRKGNGNSIGNYTLLQGSPEQILSFIELQPAEKVFTKFIDLERVR